MLPRVATVHISKQRWLRAALILALLTGFVSAYWDDTGHPLLMFVISFALIILGPLSWGPFAGFDPVVCWFSAVTAFFSAVFVLEPPAGRLASAIIEFSGFAIWSAAGLLVVTVAVLFAC